MNNFDPSSILYEDNHIIIVNKRPGQIVQGDKTGDEPMSEELSRYLAARGNKPGAAFVGVPHRIDRPVSGIALFAKTSKALERMNALFRDGGVDKIYWAIVQERPSKESAELRGYLSRNEKQNKSYISAHPKPDAKEAVLQYKLIDKSDRYFLLEILLLTDAITRSGRNYQMRYAIKGDLKYGANDPILMEAFRFTQEYKIYSSC